MKILSLFDGISCGRIALERAGIQVDSYYASEIDKYAIQVSQKNYPDIIHIGSILDVKGEDYKNIDMIIGGSPCQDLSSAKKDGKGLQGEKSSLFFEYVRILKEVKPKYFLLENVASMKKENKEEITNILKEIYPDTDCYLINSSLLTAQNRERLYWTNIQGITQPSDKGLLLRDIIESSVPESMFYEHKLGVNICGVNATRKEKGSRRTLDRKSKCLTAGGQAICNAGATNLVVGQRLRKLTPIEVERLQTLPDNYTEGVSNTQRYKAVGNGWTVDIISQIFSYVK